MRLSIFLILFATTQCVHSTTRTKPTTLRIDERVQLLKTQLRYSLRHPPKSDPIPAFYDESDEDAPIPPILDNDALKKNDKFLLKTINASKAALRTLSTKQTALWSPTTRPRANEASKTQKSKTFTVKNVTSKWSNINFTEVAAPILRTTGSWSFDIFYRKSFPYLNTNFEWMHCTELVSPFILGAKKDLVQPRKLHVTDALPQRLLHLLSQNATALTRMEKRSIMYQVSKLNIRLFTWDVSAMEGLMGVLMTAGKSTEKPSFAGLKLGMETIIKGWTMDLSNITTLLLQAKIFRPPCIQPTLEGSSKLVRGSTVPTRATSPKSNECLFRAYGDNKDNCR